MNSQSSRIREAVRLLKQLPLDRLPKVAEWQTIVADLTEADQRRLETLSQGHRERALEAAAAAELEDCLDEARASILLQPQDKDWARSLVDALKLKAPRSTLLLAFAAQVHRRLGRRANSVASMTKRPQWLWIAGLLVLVVPIVLGVLWALGPGHKGPPSPVQGPRTLDVAFDTQGVKANIQVAQSRLMIFPESTVAEISAWVTFPEHRVETWEGSVLVLDSQGSTLEKREVTFRASNEGPIDPGQGLAIFQQFDAWPYFDRVASFQVVTTRILAREAHPKERIPLSLVGTESLTAGYRLQVWVTASLWSDRFASRVHHLDLEIENAGLKPFEELQLALRWVDRQGKTLKTIGLRPVSAFRNALPAGAKMPWSQEAIFDSEVFNWPNGEQPTPVLELKQWH